MSYDLAFWKQKPTCTASPSSIYGELLEGRAVDGLETIRTAEFVARIHQRFPGITTDGELTFWEGGGKRGMFELHSSDQHVHFCCRQMSGDDMNILIDVAAELECPLYDPQEDRRFDGRVA
jgi:hypothetical protein